ncbi:hypothetical protein ACHAXT_003320 [Thalassiosira profunda]
MVCASPSHIHRLHSLAIEYTQQLFDVLATVQFLIPHHTHNAPILLLRATIRYARYHMDRVKTLTGVPIGDLQSYLDNCNQEFETSQLYSSARDEKFTDEDLRKSVFRTITDDKLFELVESVVANLNQEDDGYSYTLRRNDVTHIKYDKGGYLKRHRDFLSTTSNLIEEYTLLLCVTPADLAEGVIGGNTIIHSFGGAQTFDTTSSGSGIVFRKDLEHEGTELQRGEKHIITANIWAVRKEQSKQVLLVTFPTEDDGTEKADAKKCSIKTAADESASYVLPVDVLSGMLLTHVQWANRAAEQEGKDEPPVVTYECRDYDFDTFGVVERVMNRAYVNEDAICKAKEALDYYGPFKREDLLVSLALEKSEAKEDEEAEPPIKKARTSSGFDRQSTLVELRSLRIRELKDRLSKHRIDWKTMVEKEEMVGALCNAMEAEASKEASLDMDLIVCETEARMHAVRNVAEALGETRYVPFKLLFVEGVFQSRIEVDMGVVEWPMMATACLVGDRDNIWCIRKVCRRYGVDPTRLWAIHEYHNLFKTLPSEMVNAIVSNVKPGDDIDLLNEPTQGEFLTCTRKPPFDTSRFDIDEVKEEHKDEGYGLGLRVGLKVREGGDVKATILASCIHEPNYMLEWDSGAKTVYLPGLDSQDGRALDNGSSLFHRNGKGEVVFTEKEADRASEFLAKFDIEGRVKSALQKKRFVLPQTEETVDAFFCNEQIYGTSNILWVCGLIRLDASGKAKKSKAQSKVFDVWPSEEARAKMDSDRTKYEDIATRPWESGAIPGYD